MSRNQAPLRQTLMSAGITNGDLSQFVDCSGVDHLTVYVTGTGTTSSGVVTLEEADWPDTQAPPGYVGTWSAITTVNASAVTGGQQSAIHFPNGAYRFVRARITTGIGGGGSITVTMVGS